MTGGLLGCTTTRDMLERVSVGLVYEIFAGAQVPLWKSNTPSYRPRCSSYMVPISQALQGKYTCAGERVLMC